MGEFKLNTCSATLASQTCVFCTKQTLKSSSRTVLLSEIDLILLRRPDFDEINRNEVDKEESDSKEMDEICDSCWLHPLVACPPLPYSEGPLKNLLIDTASVVEVGGVPTSLILCKQCLSSLRHG